MKALVFGRKTSPIVRGICCIIFFTALACIQYIYYSVHELGWIVAAFAAIFFAVAISIVVFCRSIYIHYHRARPTIKDVGLGLFVWPSLFLCLGILAVRPQRLRIFVPGHALFS